MTGHWYEDISDISTASGPDKFNEDSPQVQLQPIGKCERLPDHPVQLESRAEEIIGKLKGRTMLVISGMGGIGKTTLAKQVFNTISKNLNCTCFVENVKDIASHKLQKRIAQCFYFGSQTYPSHYFDWSDVEKLTTLLILDGVDSADKLKILPNLEQFGKDSCVIITTRNVDILESYKNVTALQVYEVDFLDKQNAKTLFCQHAFGLVDIPDCAERSLFEKIVNAIVRKCEGVPLTLEVLGRYLRGHEANANANKAWEETRYKLERAEAISSRDQRLLASLRVSYDALSDEEKEMFNDAATFFFKRPLHKALVVWSKAASANHETNWANLVSRSLVQEVWNGSCYEVSVHESLRDLATSVGNSDMASGTGDEAKKLVHMLNRNQVNSTTRILQLSYLENSHGPLLQSDSLIRLKGLKSIELHRIPLASRTMNGDMSNKMDNLAVLDLRECQILKDFPETLGNFSNLRMLTLRRLKGLKYLPENFGNLTRLTSLDIGCAGDLTLPEAIGKLSALEYLFLTGVAGRYSPKPIGDLSSLPESVGDLSSLLTLRIADMTSLAALPDSFSRNLKSLKRWTISDCPLLQRLPDSFGRNLKSLKRLSISDCPLLQRLPDSFGRGLPCLEEIAISNCPRLRRLPECFSKLSGLRRLTICRCYDLEELPESFDNLSALRQFQLTGNGIRRLPANFGLLSTLEELTIRGYELVTLPYSLGFLASLRRLELYCHELKELPETLGELAQLETFELHAHKVDALPSSMENLTSLNTLKLYISGAELVRISPRYQTRPNFLRISSRDLKMVPDILWKLASEDESFRQLCPLVRVSINCQGLQELPGDWGKLPSLQHLDITAATLETLPESIGQLRSLETLRITAERLETLPESIGHIRSLKELNILMPRLRSVPETRLSSLRKLTFDCDGHKQLPKGFEHFPFGELKLTLKGTNTRVLPTLRDMRTSLKDLELESMNSLNKLPKEFGRLVSLERLTINFCRKLKSLPKSLGQISSLRHVKLNGCSRLKKLPDSLGRQREEEEGTNTTAIAQSQRFRLEVWNSVPLDESTLRRRGWVDVSGERLCYERRPTERQSSVCCCHGVCSKVRDLCPTAVTPWE